MFNRQSLKIGHVAFFLFIFLYYLCSMISFPASALAQTDVGVDTDQESKFFRSAPLDDKKPGTTVSGNSLDKGSPDFSTLISKTFKKGEVLIGFKKGISIQTGEQLISAYGMTVKKSFKNTGVQVITLPAGISVAQAITTLKSNPDIEYAEPNLVYRINTLPNDPRFDDLWGLNNTGQTGGTDDADIDAPEGWDIAIGKGDVVVGVIDTGIDYTHEDLMENMWINEAEASGTLGVDDDDNGYIDDIYGIDTFNDDADPMDDHGHGTHVAGTIGAVGNNEVGVVGVNWDVRIMALKFLSAGGYGYTDDAVECIEYVLDMRAKGVNIRVTNNSWGGGGPSQALYNAINALRGRDVLFIAAAGNSARNTDRYRNYPSGYNLDNIIAVAATDHNDDLSRFSNYGVRTVDVGAPGEDILSTLPGGGYEPVSGDIFFDDVEAGAGNWTADIPWEITDAYSYSESYSWTDSPGKYYDNNVNSSLISEIIDLSGYTGEIINLGFYARVSLEEDWDNLYIEVSGDGGSTWKIIGSLTGYHTTWSLYSYYIPENFRTELFRFRFYLMTDSDITYDGVYIDNIGIGIGSGSNNYDTYSGTSMACPHVSGLAALIYSYRENPDFQINYLEVRNIIFGTVDPLPSLQQMILTGGRINAYGALLYPVKLPSIQSLSPQQGSEGAELTIKGEKFGDKSGIVTFYDDIEAENIISWSNTSIVVVVPIGASQGPVTITTSDGITSNGLYFRVADFLDLQASIPIGVNRAAITSAYEKIYVIGGYTEKGYAETGIVQTYDPYLNYWITGSSKPTSAANACAVVIEGLIYIVGGYQTFPYPTFLDSLEIYDPSTNTWTTGTSMPPALSGHGAVTLNGKLYVMGGNTDSGINSYLYEYDPYSDTWTQLASMNTPRSFFGTGVINGNIYIFGGNNGNDFLSSTEVYDPETNTWTIKASMNKARYDFAGLSYNDKLYALGGNSEDFWNPPYLEDIEIYDPKTDTWELDTHVLNDPKQGLRAAVLGANIFVVGGYAGKSSERINESLNTLPEQIYGIAGMVGSWDFNEGLGTIVHDATPNNNDGMVYNGINNPGATWVNGKLGTALSFDGANDYVEIPFTSSLDILDGDTPFAVSAWFKLDALPTQTTNDHFTILSQKAGQGVGRTWIYIDGATDEIRANISAVELSSEVIPAIGTWYLVVLNYDGVTLSIYVNGELTASIQTRVDEYANGSYLIGTNIDLDRQYFQGNIDEIGMYNRTLKEEEIAEEYIRGSLIAYWPMDENIGDIIYDETANKNDGNIYNDAMWIFGKLGSGLHFDGIDDYVEIPFSPSLNILEGNTPFAASAWFKVDELPTDNLNDHFVILCQRAGQGIGRSWVYIDQITNEIRTNLKGLELSSGVIPEIDTWYFVVLNYDGINLSLYVNGERKISIPTEVYDNADGSYVFATSKNLDTHYFPGSIDEVSMFDRALTAEEIAKEHLRGSLIAYWPMNENSGSIIYDETVNNNDGNIYGPAWTIGNLGTALHFDGTNDYVEIPFSPSLDLLDENKPFAVSLWFEVDTLPTLTTRDHFIILSQNAEIGIGRGWLYIDEVTNEIRTNLNYVELSSRVVPKIGAWYFVVLNYDGTNLGLYVNGEPKISIPTIVDEDAGGSYLIGTNKFMGGQFLPGAVDDFSMYDRALTAEEIAKEYERGALPPPPPDGIIDNTDPAFIVKGIWPSSTGTPDFFGEDFQYREPGFGNNTATWNAELFDDAGNYEVYVWYPASTAFATNAQYTINHANVSDTVRIDQSVYGGGWVIGMLGWVSLGVYEFNNEGGENITLTDRANSWVVADAVMFARPDSIVDNADAGFSVNGIWGRYDVAASVLGWGKSFRYHSAGSGASKATWSAELTNGAGSYEVFVWYPERLPGARPATNAEYIIRHANVSDTVQIDQSANGGSWVSLGVYEFYDYGIESITLTDRANSWVVADAVMFGFFDLADQPPIADAGPDQTVNEGDLVTLDGSNSSDLGDGIASYLWEQTNGTPVTLSDPAAVQPTFTAPDVGPNGESLIFQLTVTNNEGLQSIDTCIVNITWINQPPIAHAGPDQTVNEGDLVTLDGSNSSDPFGGIASYLWVQTGGTTVTLSDPAAVQPTFTAPNVGLGGELLTFRLTVTDNGGLQSTDTCIVIVTWVNQTPIANAGPDQTVNEGDLVTLDGSNSSDPDDGIASYLWVQTGGTTVTLSDPAAVQPTFTAPNVGPDGELLTFQLTVIDYSGQQSTDTCVVSVENIAVVVFDGIVDNADPSFSVVGDWGIYDAAPGISGYGEDLRYHAAGNGSNTATWAAELSDGAGSYEVFVWYPVSTLLATNAQYIINHASVSDIVLIDQSINGGGWVSLGIYEFSGANTEDITLTDNANSWVVADAVRFVKVVIR